MNSSTLISHGDLETKDIGKKISNFITKKNNSYPFLIFLIGELGAGKTTLCKGILRGLGHKGVVEPNIQHSRNLRNLRFLNISF